MTKQELDSYPVAPLGDKNKQAQVDYVLGIIAGDSKEESYSKCYPERYKKLNGNVKRIRQAIYMLEQGDYVSGMFRTANKQAYSRFFGKVDKVMERVYLDAINEDLEFRDRNLAQNTFLKHVPKAPEELEVKVEVDIKDQYKKMLLDRKKFMTELANEVIDVEVD